MSQHRIQEKKSFVRLWTWIFRWPILQQWLREGPIRVWFSRSTTGHFRMQSAPNRWSTSFFFSGRLWAGMERDIYLLMSASSQIELRGTRKTRRRGRRWRRPWCFNERPSTDRTAPLRFVVTRRPIDQSENGNLSRTRVDGQKNNRFHVMIAPKEVPSTAPSCSASPCHFRLTSTA